MDREKILDGLKQVGQFGAKAEIIPDDKLLSSTLVVSTHFSALIPEIILIVGGRGTGKSHLFRVLNTPEGANALLDEGRIPYVNRDSLWIVGYAAERGDLFPASDVLETFAQQLERTAIHAFWRGMLLISILAQKNKLLTEILQLKVCDDLINLLVNEPRQISSWHPYIMKELESVASALDDLDTFLARENRYLFVTYDDLDVIVLTWERKRILIQSLLEFWLYQFRRWKRIRPKIFLRSDLFSSEFLQFPDAAKLSGNKMELRWTALQLYQLVFKTWANQNDESRIYLEQAGLNFIWHEAWRWTYSNISVSEDVLRQVVVKILGEFMGAGPTKGRTFEWIPNHLQDAKGDIFPRSTLNLFSFASQDELIYQRAKFGNLLSPKSLAFAIEKVSELRISELQEEYPWLEDLRPVLREKLIPVDEITMEQWLETVEWRTQPPVSGAKAQIGLLLDLGIFRRTRDGRLHVPDIYLFGFGLKRKGGIPRPQYR